MHARVHALSAVVLFAAVTALPAGAVQRVFVASYGNDANTATNCGFANPCRGFTAAMTMVDPGGEVVALDAAGYGVVTITKSVTLTANPGFYAGISASSGNAVTIATASVNVILRGLNLNGIGGVDGVSMTDGTSLTIENCVISNFSNVGISVNTAASVRISDTTARNNLHGILAQKGASLDVSRSSLKGNSGAGVFLVGYDAGVTTSGTVSDTAATGNVYGFISQSSGTGIAHLAVSRSTASNNTSSAVATFQPSGTALLTISGSVVTGNNIGLNNITGTLESQGNNTVRQNTTNTSGTITPFSGT